MENIIGYENERFRVVGEFKYSKNTYLVEDKKDSVFRCFATSVDKHQILLIDSFVDKEIGTNSVIDEKLVELK